MAPKVAVEQLDPQTGRRVGVFPSLSDAARALDRVPSAIIMAVKSGCTSGGYMWRPLPPGARGRLPKVSHVMKKPAQGNFPEKRGVGRPPKVSYLKKPASAVQMKPAAAPKAAVEEETEEEEEDDDEEDREFGNGSITVMRRPSELRRLSIYSHQLSMYRHPSYPLDVDGGIVEEFCDDEEAEEESTKCTIDRYYRESNGVRRKLESLKRPADEAAAEDSISKQTRTQLAGQRRLECPSPELDEDLD